MSKFFKSLLLVIAILILIIITTGCAARLTSPPAEKTLPPSSASIRPTNAVVQSSAEGSVAIDIEWVRTKYNYLIFNVTMNTHSVDLDQYDLKELAILQDDAGKEYHPSSWEAAPGGHHRQGTLTFPLPDSVSQGKTKYVKIIIRDIADIKTRILKWEL